MKKTLSRVQYLFSANQPESKGNTGSRRHIWFLVTAPTGKRKPKEKPVGFDWAQLPPADREPLQRYSQSFDWKPDAGTFLTVDTSEGSTSTLAFLPKSKSVFTALGFARKMIALSKERHREQLVVHLPAGEDTSLWVDAILSAAIAGNFLSPSYKKEKKDERPQLTICFVAPAKAIEGLEKIAERAACLAESTNLVRELAILPANELTCKTYVARAQALAKSRGLKFDFFDYKTLEKKGAGAFIAVAQGSNHRDAGIVKITYEPKLARKQTPRAALVGKGITFDTGGVNVKPGNYMFGMHGDMAGSAVALALVLAASELRWPVAIEAYLAIADNAVSNQAFRPNEIVRTLNGLSIETIHTDAEGRMVLCDTLCLASESKPNLIVDFATLTGSAVRAIGTSYSAGFANQTDLREAIRSAGEKSGERCWPFPTDQDFGEPLDSEIADTKQCRLESGPDHIEAAVFLQKFVPESIPYAHIDLSSIEREGGLAHVPTKETGVGVRLGACLLALQFPETKLWP